VNATGPQSGSRSAAIDLIRGAVMLLMAVDHVRVYSGLPGGGPTVGIFFTRWITVFGRVPFFYYVLHIPLIHTLALVVSQFRLGAVSRWLFTNHAMGSPDAPEGYTWSLPLLYLVWAIAVALLYVPMPLVRGIQVAQE
jgi:uncharacterized membrane protein